MMYDEIIVYTEKKWSKSPLYVFLKDGEVVREDYYVWVEETETMELSGSFMNDPFSDQYLFDECYDRII